MASKVKFLYSGSTPLDDDPEIIEELLNDSLALHEFLPNLLSFGVLDVMPSVPKDYYQIELAGVTATPNEKRESQIIYQYDNLYKTFKEAQKRYNLDPVPLFSYDGIDRRSLVYFNHSEEVTTSFYPFVKAIHFI